MFERFTQSARTVVRDAVVTAEELRSDAVDTRHLVVALAEGAVAVPGPVATALRSVGVEPADVAAAARSAIAAGAVLDGEALASLGIDLDAVRDRADAVFGPGALERAARPRRRRARTRPFTGDAKKALELSLREAIRLGDRSIDAPHVLLGVLRADSPGGRVVVALAQDAGSDLVAVREALERERPAA
ncbi:Clp protease N-terminal domain-containing protein [Puerhibacterium puerhi]|uniref:Clp protease N-terminal domain-containing protein n=1 Tax=Puerhibacterium puerhi TaxID=2692623 RepID=UPI00135A9F25|nr:Clp protease N-terminal domain-containing protein [Puerhibacterium puerhi]